MANYESTPFTEEMETAYAPAKEIKADYLSLMNKILDLAETGTLENLAQAKEWMETKTPSFAKIMGQMSTTSTEYYNRIAKEDDLKADESVASSNQAILLVTVLASILIFAVLSWIASRI